MMSYRTRDNALAKGLSGFTRKPCTASVWGHGPARRLAASSLRIHALIA